MRRRPHETNSISLKDKYTMRKVDIRAKKMCELIRSTSLSSTSKIKSAVKNAIVTQTG